MLFGVRGRGEGVTQLPTYYDMCLSVAFVWVEGGGTVQKRRVCLGAELGKM